MNALPEFLNDPLVTRLGWTLLHFLWQGAVWGAIATVMLRALAARSAVTRYRVTLGLFVVLGAIPVFTLIGLQLASPMARDGSEVTSQEAVTPIDTHFGEYVEVQPVVVPVPDAPGEEQVRLEADTTRRDVSFIAAITQRANSGLPWVVCCWLVGVAGMSLRMCGGWWWTRRLVTVGAQPLNDAWNRTIDRLCRQLYVSRSVRFVESSLARAPLVIGWLRPVVVLPASILSGLSPQEIECLLAHELAHIRRHDYLVNLGQCVMEVLLFYHPVVWWLSRRMRQERECVCDELAAAVTGDRLAYSRALLSAAEIAARAPRVAVAGTQGDLSQRVHALLGLSRTSGRASGWIVIGLAALVLIAVVSLNSIRESTPDDEASAEISDRPIEMLLAGDVILDPIAGVIVDVDGQPLVDVQVTLREGPQAQDGTTGTPSKTLDIARTTTDERGRFRFQDVSYSSPFRHDAYPLDVVAVSEGRSVGWRHLGSWSPDEDRETVRIVMREEATVQGHVLDENGDPLPDASVRLKYLMSIRHVAQADLEEARWPRFDDRRFVDTAWFNNAPSVRTDENGQFKLAQLPAESGVILEVAHPNYQLADLYSATVAELDAENATKMKRLVQTGEVRAQLERGYVIHVQVVEDATGEPVAGARYPEYLRGIAHPPRLLADNEGRFTLQHLEAPQAYMYVYPPEGSSLLGAAVRITLPTEQREHDVTVRLQQGAVVAGWVIDSETEQGIEGVRLYAGPAEQIANTTPASPITVASETVRPLVTDTTGAFRTAVPPGQVTFRLWDVPGYQSSRLANGQSILDAEVQAWVVADLENPVNDLLMELAPTPSVAGVVRSPEGEVLADVDITASVHIPSSYGTTVRTIREVTDAQGRYRIDSLFDHLTSGPADPMEVIFRHPDRELAASILFDPPQEGDPRVRTRDIELHALGRAAGRILNYDTGEPVPGARVHLYKRYYDTNMSGAVGPRLTTDNEGRFEVRGAIPDREHHLSISASGFQHFNGLHTKFTPTSGATHDFGDLVLVPEAPPDVPDLAPIEAPDVSSLAADDAFLRLKSQFERDNASYRRQLDEADEREQSRIVRQREPTPTYAAAMLELAQRHPDTDAELRALVWLVDAPRIAGTAERVAPMRMEAAGLLMEKYIDRAELAECVTELMFSQSNIAEAGWRLVNESPHEAVRGAALFELAVRELNMLDRSYDPAMRGNREEAITLLERVIEEFGALPHWRHGTYGKAAEHYLFELRHLAVGAEAPEITGRDTAGNQLKLSEFRGRVVVLNFWGSWCGPCIGKIPALNRLAEEFGDDVAVLGVASDTPQDARQAVSEHSIAYRSWVDGERGPIIEQWNVSSWPTTYVVDAAGIIRHVNPRDDVLRQVVWELLQAE